MILDAITSSPFNVFFSIVIGIGLVYLFCRKPSSSSSSSSSSNLSSAAARSILNNNASRSSTYGGIVPGIIDQDIQRVIAQKERQERDMIRQEQDAAYQQSLKADREKQMKRKEEERRREKEKRLEQERLAKQEQLLNSLMKLRKDIKDKLPSQAMTKEAESNSSVKLVFKLPNGSRVQRIYKKSDTVKYLYWYIFSLDEAPFQFRLTTNFPKRDLPGRPPIPEDFETNTESNSKHEPNCEKTLEEAGLIETQIIFVHDLEA